MQAATPVLELTQSTGDAGMLVDGDVLAAITKSVGSMALNPENECAKFIESGNSGDSSSMRVPSMHDKDDETATSKCTKARRSSVRFSQMEPVAVTRSPPSPETASPTCGDTMRSQILDAGHTPYSAAMPSHVTFADQTISVSEGTPGACSNQEGLVGSDSSDGEEGGQVQGFRSLNAGATPRHCDQSHVKFSQCMTEVAPIRSTRDVFPTTPEAEGRDELSADESRHLSMNAGCTPGAGHLSCGGSTQAIDTAKKASVDAADSMRTDSDLVAGPLLLDGTMRAPAAAAGNRVPVDSDTDSSAVAACLTFKSDAVQSTAAAQRCKVSFAESEGLISATLAGPDYNTTPAVRLSSCVTSCAIAGMARMLVVRS